MSETSKPKSYISFYWKIWFLIILSLLLIKFLVFIYLKPDYNFLIFSIYMIPVWLTVMILNFYEGHKLIKYLKKNHNEKWKELTYCPILGYGNANGFRTIPFLFSKNYLGDNVVLQLKNNYKNFLKLALTIFFTSPIVFFLIMLN